MNPPGKPLVWLRGEIKTPPFTAEARVEAGHLLRLVQLGWKVGMPHSRPMPTIAPRCHELRIKDARSDWRIVYRVDSDAVVICRYLRQDYTHGPRPDNCGLQAPPQDVR